MVATLNNSVAIFLAFEQEALGQVTLLVLSLVAKKDADWRIMKTRMSTNEVFILAGLLKKPASIILVGSILSEMMELSVNFLRCNETQPYFRRNVLHTYYLRFDLEYLPP